MERAFNYFFLYPPFFSVPTNLLNLDKKELSPSFELDTECDNAMTKGVNTKTTINVTMIKSSLIAIFKCNILIF